MTAIARETWQSLASGLPKSGDEFVTADPRDPATDSQLTIGETTRGVVRVDLAHVAWPWVIAGADMVEGMFQIAIGNHTDRSPIKIHAIVDNQQKEKWGRMGVDVKSYDDLAGVQTLLSSLAFSVAQIVQAQNHERIGGVLMIPDVHKLTWNRTMDIWMESLLSASSYAGLLLLLGVPADSESKIRQDNRFAARRRQWDYAWAERSRSGVLCPKPAVIYHYRSCCRISI